ncbi:MAG: acyl-CoA thioesterase [Geminicoccaceae bacterium]
MTKIFETVRKVEFQHCDPAGLVFYPRYFEMINSVIEEWFETALDESFFEIHVAQRRAVPTARIEAEFHAPTRLGEVLDFALSLTDLGGSSARPLIRATCGGEPRMTVRSVLVHVAGEPMRAQPWPDNLRTAMQSFIGGEAS